MRIAVSGASGMVGAAVSRYFQERGDQVLPLVRPSGSKMSSGGSVLWDPSQGSIEGEKLEGVDAVIHLAGANIADRRWSDGYKRIILDSRRTGTELLSRTLAGLKNKPRVLISASAIGFYGNYPFEQTVDEQAPQGRGFLSYVCKEWEDATRPASIAGIRVVNLRIGVVLSRTGGALAKMLPVFRMGLGGPLGNGRQGMSWVGLDELPRIMDFLIARQDISGPVNGVSPQAVTNAEFTRVLGQALSRPVIFPVPAFAIKFALGEMGEELLLGGARIYPKRLMDVGYVFARPDLAAALKDILG